MATNIYMFYPVDQCSMSLSNVGNHLPTRLYSSISQNSAVLRIGGGLYVMLLAIQNVNTLLWWFIYYVVKFIEILLYMHCVFAELC